MVATSPAFSHRLPHVFARPEEFKPGRFLPPCEEDKAVPFSFIGFGGGRHGCMGSNFAILQVHAHGHWPAKPLWIAPVCAHKSLSAGLCTVHLALMTLECSRMCQPQRALLTAALQQL